MVDVQRPVPSIEPNTSRPTPETPAVPRPPGPVFYLLAAMAASALLFAASTPGFNALIALAAVSVLALGAVIWTFQVVRFLAARRGAQVKGRLRALVIAPLGGVIVLLLLVFSVPLRARRALSQSAFDAVVAHSQPTARPADSTDIPSPGFVGLYPVSQVHRQGDAAIFYESTGSLFDDAGFAYLPSGPFPELESGNFENPQFRHLSGPWYAWTASW